MINKIKQIFCIHQFIINNIFKTYITVGDRKYNRSSYEYHMECSKCGKKQKNIKKYDVLDKEKTFNYSNIIKK